MVSVAIVYHSGYGHTTVIAEHILLGIESVPGVECFIMDTENVDWARLEMVDTIVLGSPTYMGGVSASMKAFMDESSKIWFTQDWKNKLAAGFTNSHSLSGDKFNCLVQMVTFAAQHGMIWLPLAIDNESSADDVQSGGEQYMNRLGSYLGLMAQSENESPEVTPPVGDKNTAELFGKQIAEATLRWACGA